MDPAPTVHSYSFRQVNPFRGNLQVVNLPYCRGLSADGKHWQIQVSCEVHQQEWGIQSHHIPRRYVVAGAWQADTGFASMPLEPMLDTPDESTIHAQLLPALEAAHPQLPLPQQDHYEYWLLDSEQRPVALLHTALDQPAPGITARQQWRATSPLTDTLPRAELQGLAQAVNMPDGKPTSAHWFQRQADGSGTMLSNAGIELPMDAFPPLLLREQWQDPKLEAFSHAYQDHLAPWLLLWQGLDDQVREHLEFAAQANAVMTDRLLPLYPRICDEKFINRIRVEAHLRSRA